MTDARPIVFSAQDACLDGHFPGNPLVPGVAILERIASEIRRTTGDALRLETVRAVKFSSPLKPGEALQLSFEPPDERATVRFEARVDTRLVASGTLVLAPRASAESWEAQRERSTPFMLRVLLAATFTLGRGLMRFALWPVAAYFWLTARAAREASHAYLERVAPGSGSGLAVLKHFHTFATLSIDRMYLLSGRGARIDVTAHVPPEVLRIVAAGRGCVLLVAHFGSFEALRVKGTARNEMPIRIVLDRQVGQMAMRLFERLNPTLAANVIDAADRSPAFMLQIKQAVEAGHMVGIMADRARADERAVEVRFLDGTARVPAGPWLIAAALRVPVFLGFGVYRGAAHYDCYLELHAERVEIPRETRAAALQAHAQRFATRLEEHVRSAPLNWSNFYDFWVQDEAPSHATARH